MATPRKAPPLGPIHRAGVALPFGAGGRSIKMTIYEPALVGRVAEALRRLPSSPHAKVLLHQVVPETFAAKLKPFTPGVDDPIEWVAAELTGSIQAGILMDQVPEFDRLTDKQKLAQLDELDAAFVRLDQALGPLRLETWNEVVAMKSDLPPTSTIVREGIYHLWPGLHDAVREARRRLQDNASKQGKRARGSAARATAETAKVYQWITGKEAKTYNDAVTGERKGEFLPFLTEIFDIFGIEGNPGYYSEKEQQRRAEK
jgi:hypothetical protein